MPASDSGRPWSQVSCRVPARHGGEQRFVGIELARLRQLEETDDAGAEQPAEPLARRLVVDSRRMLAGEQSSRLDPVAVRQRVSRH